MELAHKSRELYELQARSFNTAAAAGGSAATDSRFAFMPVGGGGPVSSSNIGQTVAPSTLGAPVANMAAVAAAPASLASTLQDNALMPNQGVTAAATFFLSNQVQPSSAHVTRSSPINMSNLNPEAMVYSPVSHAAVVQSSAANVSGPSPTGAVQGHVGGS